MKLLTDNQTPSPFVALLRQLGWDVLSVHDPEVGLAHEKDDAKLVAWAWAQDRVFVSMDTFARKGVWKRINSQIRNRGGKVITLSGGPEQDFNQALGRFLFFETDWRAKLSAEDGWYRIHTPQRGGSKWISKADLGAEDPEIEKIDFTHIDEWVIEREFRADQARKKRGGRPTRTKDTPREQGSFDSESWAEDIHR